MVTAEEAMARFIGFMGREGCSQIVTPNPEIVLNASRDERLKRIISDAELVAPDGVGLVYASRIIGTPLKEKVAGIDLLSRILEWMSLNGGSAYFLGGRPGVAALAAENMRDRHPGLSVAGARDGYFKPEEEEAVVEEINGSGADFLCVALGSPKQELFINRFKGRLRVKAAIGAGGSLDVMAGAVKRAPKFYRDHGLEWLYRLLRQPSRIGRMAALPLFMLRVLLGNK
jgi:N-acetylglucosaminyldiphosphoundecaprenol N-acetyl-beta-D-mannosaminyltransferase